MSDDLRDNALLQDGSMNELLKYLPLFAGLPEADMRHLLRHAKEVKLPAGKMLFEEGDPGDNAYVVERGELEIIKDAAGREVLLAVNGPGALVGEMALLEDRPRMAGARARTDCDLLAIDKDEFSHLLQTSHAAARAIFNTILSRWRDSQAMLRQSEKMAQLGTLTAGVAHELNNPAAAVRRGAGQLESSLGELARAQLEMGGLALSGEQQQALEALAEEARQKAASPPSLDALARSDRETELEEWLTARGLPDAWELAPALVELDYEVSGLEGLVAAFPPEHLPSVIRWLGATYSAYNLLAEIRQGATRISEIVKALKSYSYLDQAPVQEVDIHEGVDDTLLILRHKLKGGITVRREYAPDLPRIQGYGSELNQVWTNILDNAVDALDGQGTITIRTRQEGDRVVVQIEDDGPGIPPEAQSRIFEAFFTTKPPGKGTGLGLDISYKIVVLKHRGDIRFKSEPGRTSFEVWLPLNPQVADR